VVEGRPIAALSSWDTENVGDAADAATRHSAARPPNSPPHAANLTSRLMRGRWRRSKRNAYMILRRTAEL